jgi:hypothetical protein
MGSIGAETAGSPIVEDALRILHEADSANIPLRLLGGLAILLHTPQDVDRSLLREPNDIDFVTQAGRGKEVISLLSGLGYEANRQFNAINAGVRQLFYDTPSGRQIDVFVGSFAMCHSLPLARRIDLEQLTVPLAELLLTKLQIVKLNEKDQRDIFALVSGHAVGDGDEETINGAYIASLCAEDWGLWRTTKMNLERSHDAVLEYVPDADRRRVVSERLAALQERIEAAPKSRRWRLRDRIGDRKRWYEDPDEVG